MQDLGGMRQLQWLDLSRTRITDAGLKHLIAMNQLQELYLLRRKSRAQAYKN